MAFRVLKWFSFSVVISLLPLVLNGILLGDHGHLRMFSDLWARGELYLISLIGTATAVGDLVMSKTAYYKRKMGIVCAAGIVGVVVLTWYVELASDDILTSAGVTSTLQAKANILAYAPWAYCCSLAVGLACVMLPPHSN